ncbi:hypothetical protein ABMA27_008566 [Loxostege sticticalis]|uniref:Metalloendopeptidase n=1 Tax=Loxostege sticticalis TaxID=481309 RepID=A0ABR3HBS9_LOXSC
MCRIFTIENEKLNRAYSAKSYRNGGRRRAKRDTGKLMPNAVEVENAKRVEEIVDKLYEDMAEDGVPVTYRQRNIDTLTTRSNVQAVKNKTMPMRRFNFAPAEILPPGPDPDQHKDRWDIGEPVPGTPPVWPKKWKHGIVPYFIDPRTYDSHLAEVIVKAFDYFERATCIRLQRLKDRPTDEDSLKKVEWLYITNPSGIRQCVHSNEKKTNKGVQMVVFGYDCLSQGEIIHEVMHQLGFSHEHTRPDRDQYITILWNNIKPGYRKYFERRREDQLMNIPYDYASVLHYPPRAFSKNGQATVMAQTSVKLGQREGLSEGDVEKVGVVYGYECVDRNKQYLLKTCPSVVRARTAKPKNVTRNESMDYFKDRIWPYGLVNYKLKDEMEFSAEEKENIKAVIRHIQKETCIVFRDVANDDEIEHSEYDKQTKNDETTTPVQENIQSESSSKETSPSNSEIGGNTTDIEHHSDEGNTPTSDNETTPKSIDAENEVKHGDDVDNKDDNIASVKENENYMRKGTTTPRAPRSVRSRDQRRKAQRRHAADIIVFERSAEPGCKCPPSGKPSTSAPKTMQINGDCFNSVNDLLHLFVHILGLDHQHNMHDRDSYLHILWENLTPDISAEMSNKLPPAASLGFDYDYQSVMHYPWLQIKNGATNIMYPIWNDGWAMGHWQGLSSTDVKKLNLLYHEQCEERKKNEMEDMDEDY